MPRPDARLLSAHRSYSPPLFFPPVNSQQRAVRSACPSDRATSPCCATPSTRPSFASSTHKEAISSTGVESTSTPPPIPASTPTPQAGTPGITPLDMGPWAQMLFGLEGLEKRALLPQ
ncbi:hypothetical protein BJV77DRAFT_1068392 [Russula vinacea]|nr:hypothetical protein BJV77DRAFT_1068392 [Russula vinacea]